MKEKSRPPHARTSWRHGIYGADGRPHIWVAERGFRECRRCFVRAEWPLASQPCYGNSLEEEKRGEEHFRMRRAEQAIRDERIAKERTIDAAIARAYAAQAAKKSGR